MGWADRGVADFRVGAFVVSRVSELEDCAAGSAAGIVLRNGVPADEEHPGGDGDACVGRDDVAGVFFRVIGYPRPNRAMPRVGLLGALTGRTLVSARSRLRRK